MKTVVLKVVSAIAVAGQVVTPGELIEVTQSEAKNLLHRGKCVVATEADGAPAASSAGADAGGDGPLNPELSDFAAEQARIAEENARVQAEAEADAAAKAKAEADALAAEEAALAAAEAARIAAELAALLTGTVAEVSALLDGLDDASLAQLRALESADEKPRTTLIAAIDEEIAKRAAPNT
jgi:hypothetical protein